MLLVLYTVSAASLLLDLLVERHVEHPFESMSGFYPLYGFVGCVTLVLAARLLRRLIIRPEDYYSRRDLPQHPDNAQEERAS
ncbi:hypothetical protein FV139_08940 [Parahaliea maris]|uniref:Uncharacterized protein n=1 Tax=Parahaliea maris TaxID=2716870 RepID=A0A5C9A2J0_9GAMM|nr:hypothetical protein FV139_08940 [Parahaliea maris]